MDLSREKIVEYNRTKIYQKLERIPEPSNYKSNIPWSVQQQIAATNGMHYIDRIGKLNNYPQYELPIKSVQGDKLMLDIGCGWGRWLVAGQQKGYVPIGVDIRLEFCKTANHVMKDQKVNGYTVVGDLENMPFADSIFDLIWSFSVIQHTHYKRLINCLKGINRILTREGYTKLELPNKSGLRNSNSKTVSANLKNADDYNSWDVRYYTPGEYREIFEAHLDNFEYENHSFLGIGVLKEDLKYVSIRNKVPALISLLLSQLTKVVPSLKNYSDSLYISSTKKSLEQDLNVNVLESFFNDHRTQPGLISNIVPLLRCPKYGGALEYNEEKNTLISNESGVFYTIEDNIPILIDSEARTM